MKTILLVFCYLAGYATLFSQTNPAITSWLINTDNTMGQHYVAGNSTPVADPYLANVESVHYTPNNSLVSAAGIPSYIIGPYLDGNPSNASDNEHIFKIPLNPIEQTGTKTATNAGVIGVFINGVPMYDWRDAQSYNNQGVWNRDAVLNELDGFDCPKGHPSPIFSGGTLVGGTYHHHQNPTAFNLDNVVLSDICDTYPADGLYVMNATVHSPLLGFAFDGFPVYGAYGYANTDGTGGIVRIESGYEKRNITVRTHYADGTDVIDGPAVSVTYPLGTYKEDYEFTGNGDLDEYNGRFAVTPEYPAGIYAYYATVDANQNSAFPYMIGPDEYYGVVSGGTVNSVPPMAVQFVLPIELVTFDAVFDQNQVMTKWITASEINNDFFTLERSANGRDFVEIATIQGAGTSDQTIDYNYVDKDYLEGTSYYRLKQTDYDGTYAYSDMVTVKTDGSPRYNVNIFPNPSVDFIAIQVSDLVRKDIEIELFDVSGQLLKTTIILPGSTIATIDTQLLYDGTYLVRMTDGLQVSVHKVIIHKE